LFAITNPENVPRLLDPMANEISHSVAVIPQPTPMLAGPKYVPFRRVPLPNAPALPDIVNEPVVQSKFLEAIKVAKTAASN
jgi:hypothetical protein